MLLASTLLLQDGVVEIVGVVMLLLLIAYCCLRGSRRLEVFGCAAAPGAVGTHLHDLTGLTPRWGLVLMPFVFAQLVAIDRADRHTGHGRR